jgi:glycosyltransferase involved in cell wall biosynthesis
VTPFFPPSIGGISTLVYNLCNSLTDYDIDISIIASSKNIVETAMDKKIRQIIRIRSFYFPGWPYSTLKNFSVPLDLGVRINSVIQHEEFDIVHLHGHHYPITWMALKAAYNQNIPTVLSLHGTYALNPKNVGGKSKLEDVFNKYIFKGILTKSDVVIGGTREIIGYAKRILPMPSKFRLIPNGVNTKHYETNLGKKFDYRKKLNLSEEKLIVLFVGRFDESKGALEFAKAAKLLLQNSPDKFQVLMVGQGALESEIRKFTNGIDGIKIMSWQPNDLIHEVYIAADIFILPSKFEGLPLSIIESMNANLYIIYSNVGGVDDILRGYGKKRMLNSASGEEIYNILGQLYYDKSINTIHSPSITYARTFDWTNIAQDVATIYKELARKN